MGLQRLTSPILLAWVLLAPPASAQIEQAWRNSFDPPQWDMGLTYSIDAVADNGVVTVSQGNGGSHQSLVAEVVIRRLTENGDLLWEREVRLPTEDYGSYSYRRFFGDLAASANGEVAFTIGTPGPTWIYMIEPDGSIRWRQSISPIVGPHFQTLQRAEFAPDGDLALVAPEGTFASSTTGYGLYRFDGSSGSLRWRVTDSSSRVPYFRVAGNGDVVMATTPTNSTSSRIQRIDRLGAVVATRTIPQSLLVGSLEVSDSGRVAVGNGLSGNWAVLSLSPSLAIDWTFPLVWRPTNLKFTGQGDLAVLTSEPNSPHRRINAQGHLVYEGTPRGFTSHAYTAMRSLPNGNLVLSSTAACVFLGTCTLYLEERGPLGEVIRATQFETPGNPLDLAIDFRGNGYLAHSLQPTATTRSGIVDKFLLADPIGASYCAPSIPNSTGFPARLRVVGKSLVSENNLSLVVDDLPAQALVLPLASRSVGLSPGAGGSQGTLCLGGSIGRFNGPGEVRSADDQGRASIQLELSQFPMPTGFTSVMAGERWHFQAWYRDANPASTSNFTSAVTVAFL